MTVARVGFAVVALACAAGCTGSPGSPVLRSSPSAAPVTTAAAPSSTPPPGPVSFPAGPDNLCAPLPHPFKPQPRTGFLARSSTVRAARWCVSVFTSHVQRVQLVQSTGDVTALDRALHAPRPTPLASNVPCPASVHPVFVLEVLDQQGRVYRPTLPTSPCGEPAGTRDALAATAYTVLSSTAPTTQ